MIFSFLAKNLSAKLVIKFFLIKFLFFFIYLDLKSNYLRYKQLNYDLTNKLKLEPLHRSNYFYFRLNDNNNSSLEHVNFLFKNVSFAIKAFITPISGDYIQEPISDFILKHFLLNLLNNSFLSGQTQANLVTLVAILICIPCTWLLADTENSRKRKLACLLFQFKNLLDYIDGPLVRASGAQVNKWGRVYDAIGNFVPTVFFIIGSYVFILKSLNMTQLSLKNEIYKQLNVYYRFLYNFINFLSKKFKINNSNRTLPLNGSSDSTKTQLQQVFLRLTLFVICFIMSGSMWNTFYEKYVNIFAKYDRLDEVNKKIIFGIP